MISDYLNSKLIFNLPLDERSGVRESVTGNSLQQASSNSSSFVWDSNVSAYKFQITGTGQNYGPYIFTDSTEWSSIINTGNTHEDYTISFDIRTPVSAGSDKWYRLMIPNVNFSGIERKLCVNPTSKTSDTATYQGIRCIQPNIWYRFISYAHFVPGNTTTHDFYWWRINLSNNTQNDIYSYSWTQTNGAKATNDASKLYLTGAKDTKETNLNHYIRNVKVYKGYALQRILNGVI